MKSTSLHLLSLLALASATMFPTQPAFAASAKAKAADPFQAALLAADEERVAAIMSGDARRLDAIFSDALSYTHSSGDFDTKFTYLGKLVSGATKYTTYQTTNRKFTLLGPGLAMMNARIRIIGRSEASPDLNTYLSVLAIFREEQGKWRFLAWQSARLPLPDAPPAKK